MKQLLTLSLSGFLISLSVTPHSGLAQQQYAAAPAPMPMTTTTTATANQFNEVFMTAGYSAAFGAATAAALLVFFPNPEQNLKFVLGGASAGFVAGGLYSVYRMNSQYKNADPINEDFGPLPPTQRTHSSNTSPAPSKNMPRGALLNTNTRSVGFDFPRFALAPNAIAVHLLQIQY